jgi:hypothetical protein
MQLMVLARRTQNGKNMKKQEEKNSVISVVLPEDKYALLHSSKDGLPAIIVVNTGLRVFKDRDVFGWTCSVHITFKDLADNGLPTLDDAKLALDFFDRLNNMIIDDENHPNALFVSRCTHNGRLAALWQVHDPDIVSKQLQSIIDEKQYPLDFAYEIVYDDNWREINWYLQDFEHVHTSIDRQAYHSLE